MSFTKNQLIGASVAATVFVAGALSPEYGVVFALLMFAAFTA